MIPPGWFGSSIVFNPNFTFKVWVSIVLIGEHEGNGFENEYVSYRNCYLVFWSYFMDFNSVCRKHSG